MSIFTLLSGCGGLVSILRVPVAAAISPFVSTTEPPHHPVMNDDVSEDRPQYRELRPLLFSNSVWVRPTELYVNKVNL